MTTRLIEHADALEWLARQERGTARVVCFDPPYSRGTPMRGREDGMAGSVYEPFGFLHDALMLSARTLLAPAAPGAKTEFDQDGPYGIVICFCDWELLPTLGRLTSMSGLRQRTHLVWLQGKPGGGRLFRGDADPVLIVSAHAPDVIGGKHASADKNWILAKAPQGKKRCTPTRSRPRSTSTSSGGSAAAATWSSIRSLAAGRLGWQPSGSAWTWSGAAVTLTPSTRSRPGGARCVMA